MSKKAAELTLNKLVDDRKAVAESVTALEAESANLDGSQNGNLVERLEEIESLLANRRRVIARLDEKIRAARLALQDEQRQEIERKAAGIRKKFEAATVTVVEATAHLQDAITELEKYENQLSSMGAKCDRRRVTPEYRQAVKNQRQHWANWHRPLLGLQPRPTGKEAALIAAERKLEAAEQYKAHIAKRAKVLNRFLSMGKYMDRAEDRVNRAVENLKRVKASD